MTKLLISCLLAVAITFGCRPIEPIILPVLSADQATIPLHKSVRFAPDIAVQVTDILDSRCPQGAFCTLAGTASVTLSITKGSDVQNVQLQLHFPTLAQRVDSTGVIFTGASYKVILRNVVPYPDISKRLPPKQVIVQVTKL